MKLWQYTMIVPFNLLRGARERERERERKWEGERERERNGRGEKRKMGGMIFVLQFIVTKHTTNIFTLKGYNSNPFPSTAFVKTSTIVSNTASIFSAPRGL